MCFNENTASLEKDDGPLDYLHCTIAEMYNDYTPIDLLLNTIFATSHAAQMVAIDIRRRLCKIEVFSQRACNPFSSDGPEDPLSPIVCTQDSGL